MTMNPVITSRTVTGPGMKSRPMATYCEPSKKAIARARSAADTQRQQREAREYAQSIAQLEQNIAQPVNPFPPAPEMPAKLALHQEQDPDPVLNAEFILGLLAGAMLASTTIALLLGAKP